ncbi:MAG: hypothetical protein PUD74_07235 [Bacteroidales bacterium]|nr:hypothetical protein [Bacteroidales bacterium]
MVSYVGLTDRQTGHPYRQPYRQVSSARLSDRQTARLAGWFHTPAFPTVRPACLTDSLTGQPHRPASPVAQPTSPTDPTGQPNQPPSPAIHPGKGRAGLPYR